MEDELVALANGARAGSGLRTLWVHQGLVGFARGHAATLAAELNLYHQDMTPILDQTDLNWAAENVACGQPDAATAHLAWWNSPGHRENLMNPEFDRIGVGCGTGPQRDLVLRPVVRADRRTLVPDARALQVLGQAGRAVGELAARLLDDLLTVTVAIGGDQFGMRVDGHLTPFGICGVQLGGGVAGGAEQEPGEFAAVGDQVVDAVELELGVGHLRSVTGTHRDGELAVTPPSSPICSTRDGLGGAQCHPHRDLALQPEQVLDVGAAQIGDDVAAVRARLTPRRAIVSRASRTGVTLTRAARPCRPS